MLLATAVMATLGSGCGGGGTTTPVIAKAAFVRRANTICARTYDRVRASYLSFVKGVGSDVFSQPAKVREYADGVLVPAKKRELEELRALGAPREEEDEVGTILEAYEEGIERAERDPHAAVLSTFGVFVKATELAKKYGLEECRY